VTDKRIAWGVAAFLLSLLLLSLAWLRWRAAPRGESVQRCGPGFSVSGVRCCPTPERDAQTSLPVEKNVVVADACARTRTCPAPLVLGAQGFCDAPLFRVLVPAAAYALRASDWEAEGKVATRSVRVAAFEIDAFEITTGQVSCATCALPDEARYAAGDHARAQPLSREQAGLVCAARSGRLPSEDEWLTVATRAGTQRYPWGDTGAVCRRAAWGLLAGPCAYGATGADTVAAHTDGTSALGVFDLAGNLAEWVIDAADPNRGVVYGGDWQSSFAADLRGWKAREADPNVRDSRIGARCVYDLNKESLP
jgi:formylglycine-generating enzyme